MVERGVDHARRDAIGDLRAQGGFASATRQPHPVAVAHATLLGVVRMDLEPVLGMPDDVVGAAGRCADARLAENTPRRQQRQGAWSRAVVGLGMFGDYQLGY